MPSAMQHDTILNHSSEPNRRHFLYGSIAASLVTVLHPSHAISFPQDPDEDKNNEGNNNQIDQPLIHSLQLLTAAPLSEMKEFYHDKLGLTVLDEQPDRLTIAGGKTPITFVSATSEQGNPWYHVAFNVPENKLRESREWLLQRSPIIPAPVESRDPDYPDDVRHFAHWNSHAFFFWDPAGNLLEFIARHDLKSHDVKTSAVRDFTTQDIHYASEIGFVVDEQAETARHIHEAFGLQEYPKKSEPWWAMGDECGLLLCVPKRIWGEYTDNPKRFAVYPTEAVIYGGIKKEHTLPDYPYKIQVV